MKHGCDFFACRLLPSTRIRINSAWAPPGKEHQLAIARVCVLSFSLATTRSCPSYFQRHSFYLAFFRVFGFRPLSAALPFWILPRPLL